MKQAGAEKEAKVRSPTRWTESERLTALRDYGILDTPSEPAFDDIAKITAHICQAPVALVSLVDDKRQWFKAGVGLGQGETSREVSICAYAILQPEQGLFVVPDAAEDPRFAANPLVIGEPNIRFYAGAPLITPEGLPLGTLCVIDFQPRPRGLTDQQGQTMMALARQVITQLEHRRALVRLAAQQAESALLARELSHRIKNIFAVVGGIAALSARGHPEAKGFADDFRQRVNALARAHEYVRPQNPENAPGTQEETVQGLMRALLAPYLQHGHERVVIKGDDAPIGAKSATALALIMHEQATNAVKYGSLSTEMGRVRITAERGEEFYGLTWTEMGGPEVSGPPERRGFGTQMAERSVTGQLGGNLTQDWKREGFTMTCNYRWASCSTEHVIALGPWRTAALMRNRHVWATQASMDARASESGSLGCHVSLGRAPAKWITCWPVPLANSRMRPLSGKTRRRASRTPACQLPGPKGAVKPNLESKRRERPRLRFLQLCNLDWPSA